MIGTNIAQYTFAIKRTFVGNFVLLAKKKNLDDSFRVVEDNRGVKLFKTKTSAYIASEEIELLGIEKSGYKLGKKVYGI